MTLKVVHVIPGLATSSGPSQAMANLCHHQLEAGIDVEVCYVSGRGADPDETFPSHITVHGFSAVGLKKWAYAPTLKKHLYNSVGECDVVHIHSMWLYPSIAASKAAKFHRKPYLVRPAGSLEPWSFDHGGLKKRLYLRFISRGIMNNAARIHAVSEQEEKRIETFNFDTHVVTIPNGINLSDRITAVSREQAIQELDWPAAKTYLLFLGRIHPQKGLDLLFKIFEDVSAKEKDIRLIIAGPDNHTYAHQLKEQQKSHPFGSRIHFVGQLTGRTKSLTLSTADLFVLPSKTENFGISILEAMAAGTPVVVSNTTPWKVVTEKGAGYWLPLESAAFVSAINDGLDDPKRLSDMGEAAAKIANNYSWTEIAKHNIECYEQIMAEHKTQ